MSGKSKNKMILIISTTLASLLLFIIAVGITISLTSNTNYDTEITSDNNEKEIIRTNNEGVNINEVQETNTSLEWSGEQEKLFNEALRELINTSEGSILDARPYLKDGNWSNVAVVVNDAWYYLQDYEKERFAEQISSVLNIFLKESQRISREGTARVVLIDINEKELASPTILSGYKIKR